MHMQALALTVYALAAVGAGVCALAALANAARRDPWAARWCAAYACGLVGLLLACAALLVAASGNAPPRAFWALVAMALASLAAMVAQGLAAGRYAQARANARPRRWLYPTVRSRQRG